MEIELGWPSTADDRLRAEVHEVLHAVVAADGAIGWTRPPDKAETDAWLDRMLHKARAGDGAMVVARADGVVRGTAVWQREDGQVFRHCAELGKVTAHPEARGLGLGRVLVEAVITDARKSGLELLTLGVRGNNHGAIELYEGLGFQEWGRLPNSIAVGEQRFDSVRMVLRLGYGDAVVLNGSTAGGLGSSPRRQRPGPQERSGPSGSLLRGSGTRA
jgi:ribosomal protein S18 acetylase RimI-like enzyme